MRNKIKSSLGRPPAIDLTKDDEPSTSTELILLMDTASFAEGVPTMASLTATSSSNDTCCDIAHSERVELETFLQQPPIVMEEPVSHPKSTVWKGLPFVREFRRFQSLVCAPSSPLFHDFSHFFKVLKRADDKWRFHRFAREDIPDPAKRPPFIEERINVYVRDNGNLPASNCFNVGMVEDVDFFVGESRLLQYCALRCLQLGDIALCKAIAKVRKEAFYPDYASNIDWETRLAPSLALSTSSRSSSTAAACCPPLSTAEGSNTSPETRERPHFERVELETFLRQPPIVMEEPVSHPKSTVWKGFPFVLEFRRFQSLVCAPSSPLFHDVSHFFKVLKRADDKWRFHRFAREDIPDPAKRPPFIEERINVYVRDNGNLPASNCFNVGMVEDVDFFVGESRLLQYCALHCLQLGDIALCKAIAKVRKEAFYPDYASNIDWETRSTPSLALSTSSRSSSTAAASCPPLSTAEGSNTSPETKELEEETLFNKEAISDEDSDEIESHGSKPRRPPHEPHGAADSKPVPTRQRWTSAKVRGNRDLTFYNPKKG